MEDTACSCITQFPWFTTPSARFLTGFRQHGNQGWLQLSERKVLKGRCWRHSANMRPGRTTRGSSGCILQMELSPSAARSQSLESLRIQLLSHLSLFPFLHHIHTTYFVNSPSLKKYIYRTDVICFPILLRQQTLLQIDFIIRMQITYDTARLRSRTKGTNSYLFSEGGSVLDQLNVAFFTTMHPSAEKQKIHVYRSANVPMKPLKFCALDHATEVNLSTCRQRYNATFPSEQPTACQKLVFCFY